VLVVDSGGFLKAAPLREVGEQLVTLHEVVAELRDKEVRQRLQLLPELQFQQPGGEAVRRVSEFARQTGDYAALSGVDLAVLALTYQLEVERSGGSQHLRTEPTVKRTTQFYHPKENRAAAGGGDAKLPGFYHGEEDEEGEQSCDVTKSESFDQFNFWRDPLPEMGELDMEGVASEENSDHQDIALVDEQVTEQQLESLNTFLLHRAFICGFDLTCVDFAVQHYIRDCIISEENHCNLFRWSRNVSSYDTLPYDEVDISVVLKLVEKGSDISVDNVQFQSLGGEEAGELSEEDVGYDSDKENGEDDDDGWITPGNLKTKKAVIDGSEGGDKPEQVGVACMTTDFAMQNVCKQMGLNIIGTNGMLIRETRTWILRCYGCFYTTPRMELKFCPKCGNATLKRVSVTLNSDGSQQIHISTRRPISKKGKKFSLPAPKGGKHAVNPRLVADQREAQQRLSRKALQRNNPMGEDYLASSSPFLTKDVTSKSALLGLHGSGRGNAEPSGVYWAQRNPNTSRKNTGNRKK